MELYPHTNQGERTPILPGENEITIKHPHTPDLPE